MKRSKILMFLSASVFTFTLSGVSPAFADPSIELFDIKPSDGKVLKDTIQSFFGRLENHVLLPDRILIVNDAHIGPMYEDGTVYIRFPFWKDVLDPKTDEVSAVSKTPELSVPLTLHEVGHQILEAEIQERAKADPLWHWAFYTRMDMRGEQASLDYIAQTKARTKFANVADEELLDQFFTMTVRSSTFNEFFADVVGAFATGKPNGIYENIYFDEDDHGIANYRRFDMPLSEKDLKEISGSDYDSTVIAKQFVWSIYEKQKSGQLQISFGEMTKKVLIATLDTFYSITDGFTSTSIFEKDPIRLNRALIERLSFEFGLKACEIPLLGPVTPNAKPKWN